MGARGKTARADWEAMFARYKAEHPRLAEQCEQIQKRELPAGWDKDIPVFPADPKGIASRDSSGQVLNKIAPNLPWLIGGAADFAPSTKTRLTFEGGGDLGPEDHGGPHIDFCVPSQLNGLICESLCLA